MNSTTWLLFHHVGTSPSFSLKTPCSFGKKLLSSTGSSPTSEAATLTMSATTITGNSSFLRKGTYQFNLIIYNDYDQPIGAGLYRNDEWILGAKNGKDGATSQSVILDMKETDEVYLLMARSHCTGTGPGTMDFYIMLCRLLFTLHRDREWEQDGNGDQWVAHPFTIGTGTGSFTEQ